MRGSRRAFETDKLRVTGRPMRSLCFAPSVHRELSAGCLTNTLLSFSNTILPSEASPIFVFLHPRGRSSRAPVYRLSEGSRCRVYCSALKGGRHHPVNNASHTKTWTPYCRGPDSSAAQITMPMKHCSNDLGGVVKAGTGRHFGPPWDAIETPN